MKYTLKNQEIELTDEEVEEEWLSVKETLDEEFEYETE